MCGCPFVFGRYDTELGVPRPVFQIELCARVIRAINSMMRTFYFAQYVLKPTTTTHFFHWTLFVIFRLVNLNTALPKFSKAVTHHQRYKVGITQSWGVPYWVF